MTPLRDKLPIDPLPTAAWQRIRAEVFAELEASPAQQGLPDENSSTPRPVVMRLAWAAAAALVAVVMMLAVRKAEPVQPLVSTSRIATAASLTHATVGDATLEVAPESELVTYGSEVSGWTVVMERGRVVFAVPPREQRARFRVQAGNVVIDVIGTRFSVERSAASVAVSVEKGAVEVTAGGETRVLREGEQFRTGSEIATTTDEPMVAPPRANEPAPTLAPKRVTVPLPPQTELSRRERYEAASRLEASAPARATALYLELSIGSDGWAANALYAAGRLELERGRRARARGLFEKYLARFPTGQNAQEARALLERTQP